MSTQQARFSLGRVVATPGALEALADGHEHPTDIGIGPICHRLDQWGVDDRFGDAPGLPLVERPANRGPQEFGCALAVARQ